MVKRESGQKNTTHQELQWRSHNVTAHCGRQADLSVHIHNALLHCCGRGSPHQASATHNSVPRSWPLSRHFLEALTPPQAFKVHRFIKKACGYSQSGSKTPAAKGQEVDRGSLNSE